MAAFGDFSSQAISGAIGGIAASLVIAATGFVLQDQISALVSRQFPDCDNTSGLERVAVKDAAGAAQEEDEHPGLYAADQAIDGYFGSLWSPPTHRHPDDEHRAEFEDDPGRRTLTLSLSDEADIRLVCVNNGLGNTATTYVNWGKVRTLEVWTDEHEEHVVTTLPVLSTDEFQGFLEAADRLGDAHTVYLQLDDTYTGVQTESFDPDQCGDPTPERVNMPDGERVELRFERGCINAATPRAGLSEVVVYTAAD